MRGIALGLASGVVPLLFLALALGGCAMQVESGDPVPGSTAEGQHETTPEGTTTPQSGEATGSSEAKSQTGQSGTANAGANGARTGLSGITVQSAPANANGGNGNGSNGNQDPSSPLPWVRR